MYKRYYDGYARVRHDKDKGEVFVPQNTANTYKDTTCSVTNMNPEENNCQCLQPQKKKGLFSGSFEIDDLILIGILIFLLSDSDNDDPILPLIIGFLFLSELI